MLSNYEINNLVIQEANRSAEKRTPIHVSSKIVTVSPNKSVLTSENKFRNPQLEAATSAIQAEFDALLV
jgi:hypothetical protein